MRTFLAFSCLALLVTGCGGGKEGPTAEALSAEFKKDSDAADKKYHGKTLTLSAHVAGVNSKEETGKSYVALYLEGEKDDGPQIECAVVSDADSKALALLETQKVKITGKYKKFGKEENQPEMKPQIYLEECKIEEVGPDPSIKVTAAELAKEYATDGDAAQKKYGDKLLLLEGKFIRSDVIQNVGRACLIEGHGSDDKSFNVVALTNSEELERTGQGETVKIRAMCMGRYTLDGQPCVRLFAARPAK
jgi:hypothetical protein